MRLDNKGWGLQDLIVGLAVLFFCLLLIVSLINQNFKQLKGTMDSGTGITEPTPIKPVMPDEDYSSYKEIENAMVSATTKYNEKNYREQLLEGDKISVTLKSLIKNEYMEKVYDIKDSKILCSGYVTFIKENGKVTYAPYLKCGNKYTTEGYLKRLDAVIE